MAEESDPKPPDASQTSNEPASSSDVVLVHSPSADGQGLDVLRWRDDELSAAQLREAKEGQPIHGELVKLSKRPDNAGLFDVEVLAKGPAASAPAPPAGGRKGPAKVATNAYRAGWDQIFGRREGGEPN